MFSSPGICHFPKDYTFQPLRNCKRLSCKQAETLKREGQLKRAFPQWEERAHTHWRVASCQSGINKPRARLSTGPCCCPTTCSGIKAAAYARLAWDCRKTCKPLQRATANIDYLEHLEQMAQWTYFWALTNRLDFPSELGCSEAGRRESLTVPLIKCAVFCFKNHPCHVGPRNGQMTVLSFDRSIIFTLEVKTFSKEHSHISWQVHTPEQRVENVPFP